MVLLLFSAVDSDGYLVCWRASVIGPVVNSWKKGGLEFVITVLLGGGRSTCLPVLNIAPATWLRIYFCYPIGG
jgi:hypothetical protein